MPEPAHPDWGDMNLWATLERALAHVNRAEAAALDGQCYPGEISEVVRQLQRVRRELGDAALALAERAERRKP